MCDEPSDWDLVARARAGDHAAFEVLVTRYKRPALGFVYRMIGDADEAQDVAQDVFVRLFKALMKPRFRQAAAGAKFSTWLFRTARNAAIDVLRRRGRRPSVSLTSLFDEGSRLPDTQPDAARQLIAHELGDRIAGAVAALPDSQRAVFILADYEGLSYAEIAVILRCCVKSVETRLYRARRFLRAHLREPKK